MEQDTCKDSARLCAEVAGREIIIGLVVSADVRHLDIRRRDAHGLQLQPTALRQVDVPFIHVLSDGVHGIAGGSKGIIYFVAHLEIPQ